MPPTAKVWTPVPGNRRMPVPPLTASRVGIVPPLPFDRIGDGPIETMLSMPIWPAPTKVARCGVPPAAIAPPVAVRAPVAGLMTTVPGSALRATVPKSRSSVLTSESLRTTIALAGAFAPAAWSGAGVVMAHRPRTAAQEIRFMLLSCGRAANRDSRRMVNVIERCRKRWEAGLRSSAGLRRRRGQLFSQG